MHFRAFSPALILCALVPVALPMIPGMISGMPGYRNPGYPTRTLQDIIYNSPSRGHGISIEKEQTMKRTAISLIIGAGQKLQMDHLAIATAVVYLQRFYAIKSLVKNDYFVMSIACLYLGGKVEDSPKSVRDVLYACFEWRFKSQADVLKKLYDKEFYESAKERVFTAERSLLYALGFNFNVAHPHETLINVFTKPESPITQLRERLVKTDPNKAQSIAQICLSLANDSLKTPLCLQYQAEQVAAAVVWLVLSLYRMDCDRTDEHNRVWWTVYGLTPDILQDITGQLLHLYEPYQQQGEAAAAEQAQFTTAQQLMQGVEDGQLLLYATHTMTAEQHQRHHPPLQHQQAQLAPADNGVAGAGVLQAAPLQQQQPPQELPQRSQPVPLPVAAMPAAAAQPSAAPGKGGVAEDTMDEYDELFAS